VDLFFSRKNLVHPMRCLGMTMCESGSHLEQGARSASSIPFRNVDASRMSMASRVNHTSD
jgi:hypothetical protein